MGRLHGIAALAWLCGGWVAVAGGGGGARGFAGPGEINPPAGPDPGRVVAIVGARLIDGRGGPPVADSVVVVRGPLIAAAGPRATTPVPDRAVVRDAAGLSLLPGLVDAHFHNDGGGDPTALPALVLARGITSLRDPGLPIRDYDPVRSSGRPMPRCFLTGHHLDQEPHAHPHDAVAVRTPAEARDAVARHVADGASAIKVYYRLPPELIRAACDEAHARGVPVTAHLELVDADVAIRAGVDGVEHVTSFGTALADPGAATAFREAVRRDNEARREARYRLWAGLDLDAPRARSLIDVALAHRTIVSPTLAVFERRPGDRGAEGHHVRGFRAMLDFAARCHRAGVPLVVGSHAEVPHAGRGWAYHRELELLVECGMGPGEAIVAATSRGARFLGCGDRLGAVEPGKLADLVLVAGDPLADIGAMRSVRHVLLNGRWVGDPPGAAGPPRGGPPADVGR